ncbi:hypothetical protein [Streptomyces sp. NPDC050704]|uniref:hypothetical protein n=1 Tax=Streptomyces sp. NPDC050704 TaxID=3157219 RepID=UPI00343EDB20
MKKRLISMIVAGGAATAALAVTTGPAQAASVPQCEAGASLACVAVTMETKAPVHSISVNGDCVPFSTGTTASTNATITNIYFPEESVALSGSPTTLTYSGYDCEKTTQNVQRVGWSTGSVGVGNYRWVAIGRIWQ